MLSIYVLFWANAAQHTDNIQFCINITIDRSDQIRTMNSFVHGAYEQQREHLLGEEIRERRDQIEARLECLEARGLCGRLEKASGQPLADTQGAVGRGIRGLRRRSAALRRSHLLEDAFRR